MIAKFEENVCSRKRTLSSPPIAHTAAEDERMDEDRMDEFLPKWESSTLKSMPSVLRGKVFHGAKLSRSWVSLPGASGP